MSNAVAVHNGNLAVVPPQEFLDREKIELIKNTILRGATDLELQMFVNQCNTKRLDPMTRQIYGIKQSGGLQIFASIDGLRVIAQRSGQYAGQRGPFWCGRDGEWTDVWLAQEPPAAAKVGVLRTGWLEPMWGVATFASYGAGKAGTWQKMPDVMLAKCAEALALRKAFPDDISGLYIREEFGETETPEPRADAPQTTTARHSGTPAVEVVDAETGEIVDPAAETMQALKLETAKLAERLKLDTKGVQAYARAKGIDYRNIAGAKALRDALSDLLSEQEDAQSDQDEDEEDYDAYEGQGVLIDADVKPIDRWA